jgi:hypothetical protein
MTRPLRVMGVRPAWLRVRCTRLARRVLGGAVAAIALPAAAAAQASIVGTVHDTSGAVMAAVVVEASSLEFIGKMRRTYSEADGRYALVNLRPGTYTVTFRRTGFASVTRTGIELTGSAAITVDAELPVSVQPETVVVTAEPPALDARSTIAQASMTAAIVGAIPTGRSLTNLGVLIPSMVTWSARSQNDVGGTNNLQNIFMASHGGRVSDQRVYVDGISVRNLQSEGYATNFTPDMSSAQEVTIDYASADADAPLGGVRANYVPRAGGNRFAGSTFATWANAWFQGSNLTPELRARGFTQPDALQLTYDVNPTAGGPLVVDRVWFYVAARFQSNQNQVGGVYANRNAGNASAWTYDPDYATPGLFAITQQSANGRLTWQANARNTMTMFLEKQWRTWDEGHVNRSPEAFSRFRFPRNQLGILSWSSVLSARLLLEAHVAAHSEVWRNIGGDELLANNRQLIPVLEQGGAVPGLMYRAKNGPYTGASAPSMKVTHATLTYARAAHELKTGFETVVGWNTTPNTFNDSGLQYRFNDGVPNQITEFATPYDIVSHMNESGAFVQDRWTAGRLTVNAGLRFDYFGTRFPQQHLGPGPLVPDRNLTIPASYFYSLKDLSPRLGGAFDLFGDGKTMVKATADRYVVALPPGTGNPISTLPLAVTRTWTDRNDDFVPDCDILNPLANGECGMVSDVNFGRTVPSMSYDPAILRGWNVRPMNWEFSATVQREVTPRATFAVSYFRRVYGNFTVQDNRATAASDYTAYSVVAPLDPRLPNGGGYPVSGFYDLNPNKRGRVDTLVTSAAQYGGEIEHWNGFDVTVHVRRSRAMLEGGVSTGRTSSDICAVAAQLPEMLGTSTGIVGGRPFPASLDQCHVDPGWLTQAKVLGTYTLPRIGLQFAGTLQSMPGIELQANDVASNAAIQPSLGRPLTGGANATVTLLQPGTSYGSRLTQLDLRASKLLHVAGIGTRLNFDVYNALNANPITAANLNYTGDGSRWLQPQSVLPARLFKLSVQIDY